MSYDLAVLQAEFLVTENEQPTARPPAAGMNSGMTKGYELRMASLLKAKGGRYEHCLNGEHDYASDSEASLAVVDAMVARHFSDAEVWATLESSALMRRRIEKKGDRHTRELYAAELEKARTSVTPFDIDPGEPRTRVHRKPDATDEQASSLPEIIITDRRMSDISEDAWAALAPEGVAPSLYQHGGGIVDLVREDSSARLTIHHLDKPSLKGRLDRAADWLKERRRDLVPARPPTDVIEDMLAMDKPLPILRGVVGTPVVSSAGLVVTDTGYQQETALYYEPLGHPIADIPPEPSTEDLRHALELIQDQWLGEFPFVDQASRANTIGACITPFVRELITGPTPLIAFDAPAPGTGKGLLTDTLVLVVSGAAAGVMNDTRNEDELRKRITSVLMEGPAVAVIDNVSREVRSPTLAALLTSLVWRDRALGINQMLTLPARTMWLATGNNLKFSHEIARRVVPVRLDSKVDRPWERGGFRHPQLRLWVEDNRHQLLWALLTIVQHWLALGRPKWEGQLLGSFESWSLVIGGILHAAGIQGFMANRAEMYRHSDGETEEWRAFTLAWWELHHSEPVGTKELLPLVQVGGQLQSVFRNVRGDAGPRAYSTRLGVALAEHRDRRYGTYFLRDLGIDGHTKVATYGLEVADAGPRHAEVEGTAEVPQENRPVSDTNAGPAGPAVHQQASDPESISWEPGLEPNAVAESPLKVTHLPQVPQTDSKPAEKVAGPPAAQEHEVPQGTATQWREELS